MQCVSFCVHRYIIRNNKAKPLPLRETAGGLDTAETLTEEESAGTPYDSVFPPEGITATTIAIPSEHQYETGEEIPAGNHVTRFELDGVKYCDAVQYGSFAFVIEDDGNIIAEGEPEHEDNEVVKALREIYSLEYLGISHLNEHLFRYGDGLLAIAKSPAEKNQSVYFKDYDYDESQFYYALIYEPYDN